MGWFGDRLSAEAPPPLTASSQPFSRTQPNSPDFRHITLQLLCFPIKQYHLFYDMNTADMACKLIKMDSRFLSLLLSNLLQTNLKLQLQSTETY